MFRRLWAIVISIPAFLPLCSFSEFLETTTGVFQDTSEKLKVVASFSPGQTGIFIVSGPAIGIQEFNLAAVPKEGYKHVFVRFDEKLSSYSELVIGSRTYKVSGNLTLNLGNDEIAIDQLNPYLSVVHKPSGPNEKGSIVGFMGLNRIVMGGPTEAAILAANQYNQDIIKPYDVTDGGLEINGKGVTTPTVGVLVDLRQKGNICSRPDTPIIGDDQLEHLQTIKDQNKRAESLQKILEDNKKNPPTRGLLFLRVTQTEITALSPDQQIKIIRPLKAIGAKKPLCVISLLEVK